MNIMLRRCLFVVLLATTLSGSVLAQTLARRGWQGSGLTVESWWQSAILYQIDPLTFQDTKGNGFGDLRGVVQRLDYVQSLGVDALVLSPFPLETQDPHRPLTTGATPPFDRAYGTEDDLAQLVQEASRRRMRVLVDLPFNSTLSDTETADAARFWLSRGIAGLRLTDAGSRRIPLTPAQTASRLAALDRLCNEYPGQRVLFWDLPQSPESSSSAAAPARHMRRRTAHGRTPIPSAAQPTGVSLSKAPQLVLDGRLLALNRWQAAELRELLQAEPHLVFPLATPVLASDAGSLARSFDRLSDGAHPVEIARQIAALLLLGQAVPQLYAGQEIGTKTASGVAASSMAASAEPSPMQWGDTPGFTSGLPWLPPGPNAATANVALEDNDGGSLLNWYRRLTSVRRTSLAVRAGSLEPLAPAHPDLVAWLRRPSPGAIGAAPVLVVCNVSSHAVTVSLAAELRARGIALGTGLLRTLASSVPAADLSAPVPLSGIALPAYGVYVGELRLQPGLESVPVPARRRSGRSAIR